MADERYPWLDKDTAERLLSGEPVETADERTRTQALRLSDALRSVADVTYANANAAESAGEAAALVAFRRARAAAAVRGGPDGRTAERGPARSAAEQPPGHAGATLGTIRLAPRPRPHPRVVPVTRLGRPVRRGFATAVVGCTLGAVFVALGSTMLAAPFAGDDGPLPGGTVSAPMTGRPLASGSPDAGPQPHRSFGAPQLPLPSFPATAGSSRGAAPNSSSSASAWAGAALGSEDNVAAPRSSSPWYDKAVKVCRDYREGDINARTKNDLETAAKGVAGAVQFCDTLLGIPEGDNDLKNGGLLTDGPTAPSEGPSSPWGPHVTSAPDPSSSGPASPDPASSDPSATDPSSPYAGSPEPSKDPASTDPAPGFTPRAPLPTGSSTLL